MAKQYNADGDVRLNAKDAGEIQACGERFKRAKPDLSFAFQKAFSYFTHFIHYMTQLEKPYIIQDPGGKEHYSHEYVFWR